MGGAFVAVADNKNALYYNPAGLNLINRLGNFEKNPDMGYMRGESWELNLVSVSTSVPGNEIDDIFNACGMPKVGTMLGKILTINFGYFSDDDRMTCHTYKDLVPDKNENWPDTLSKHPELLDNLIKLNRRALEFGVQVSILEFAMHNFGFGAYLNTAAAPHLDVGISVPNFGYDVVKADAVVQTGAAFSPVDKWSVGLGFKMAKRVKRNSFEFYVADYEAAGDTLKDTWDDDLLEDLTTLKGFVPGFDIGALYQIRRDVRLGASIRNIFFSELGGESIRPNLTIGAQASPEILQSNSVWSRKINFAMDYADMADGTVTDKFFAHLNFGTEIEQVAIPYVLTIMAGTGFESGYWAWNAGFNFLYAIDFRIGSYAEERGERTGQKEQRFYVAEVNVGF